MGESVQPEDARQRKVRDDVRKYLFSSRVGEKWNKLREKEVKAVTVETLKILYDRKEK